MSDFYKYTVIAKEGVQGIQDLGNRTSINDAGRVALTGDLDTSVFGKNAVFSGDDLTSLKNIAPASVLSNRRFGTAVEINNAGQVIAGFRQTTGGSAIRLFDSNSTDSYETIATGGGFLSEFAATFIASVNNSGESVFTAINKNFTDDLLVTASKPLVLPSTVNLATLRPMIADTDDVVVKYGNQANSPILLFDNDLNVIDTIASSGDFTQLGQSPGISDDGKVVAFYGEDNDGAGIFAWSDGQTTPTRIAGISGNGILDPGETYEDKNGNGKFDSGEIDVGLFKSFDPNSRVGVSFNLKSPDQGIGTVTYIATDTNDKEGLYTSSFGLTDVISLNPEFEVLTPDVVAKVGDSISGLKIKDLNIHDPINKSGEVAFWADTDSGEAVIKASSSPTITVENVSGTVQDGTLTFKVRLAQPLARDLVLDYFTIDGSANSTGIKDKQDFAIDPQNQNPGQLIIKKGDTEADIKINIFNEAPVTNKEFEFFARNTAYEDWLNKKRVDVDFDNSGVQRNQDITDTGYRVDKYFDDPSTDFQAVGLTATENFYLVLSDSTNTILSPPKSNFLQQVSNDTGGNTNSDIYTNADGEIQKLNNSGKTWTVATGTIYDEDKPPVLAVRGTAGWKDVFDDTNPNGVGYDQFTNNIGDVSDWLKQVSQPEKGKNNKPLFDLKPHITGHSLGGALTQWIAGEYLANTNSSFALGDIVAFNTPAISDAGAKKIDPNRVDSVEINIMSSDVVSLAGDEYPADSNNVTVNLFDYNLGINGKNSILDFFDNAKAIVSTHSAPMYLNENGKIDKPSTLTKSTITSKKASSFFFTHLPDPDYFAFLAGITKIPAIGVPLALGLTFRGTTEIGRKGLGLVGFGLQTALNTVQNTAQTTRNFVIETAENAYNSALNWNTTKWITVIEEAKKGLNIFEPSTYTNLLNSGISGDLDTALIEAQNKLTQFANSTTFENDLTTAFGSELGTQAVNNLKQQWLAGDFSNLPPIEIVPSVKIGGNSGAFTALGEIYIADDFLNNNTNNIDTVVDVLLEEIGHWVENQVKEFDTPGDEGRIFASLAQGISLTPEELENLRNENDFVALSLEQPDSVNENVIDNFWKAINFFTEEAWEALAEYPDEAWIAMRSWGETGWTAVSQWTPDEWNASKQLTSAQWEATEEFTANDWNSIIQGGTNTPPQAVNDSTTTNEDTAIEIDVLSNDTDAENNPLTLSINETATKGTATVNDNGTPTDLSDDTITYTPNSNFNGTDSFTYTVSDGTDSTSATVDITVNPINDLPVAANDTAETNQDQLLTILPSDLLSNDSDIDGDELTITEVSNSANGTVQLGADGNILFTPDSDFNGLASFEYTVSDGTENTSATVAVTVNPVNDLPIATNDTVETNEDQLLTILPSDLLSNDSDIDGDRLTITEVNNSTNGIVKLNTDGNILFTPDSDFNGLASFEYTVTDGTQNTNATVEVTVNPVNDIPIATNDTVETNEDQPLTIFPSDLLSNDSDIDGDRLTITEVNNSANGTVKLNTDGNILFTPDTDFNGLASFEYTVTDGTDTTTATVEITVNPVNDTNIINGTTTRDSLLGTDSNDIITGFQGADRITTGNGQDKLVYNSIVDAGDFITDFDPLNDILD
ncbi:MAG: tandem-95 repeat protein, partial [Rivularia sp. (in: cyanobacteria)]